MKTLYVVAGSVAVVVSIVLTAAIVVREQQTFEMRESDDSVFLAGVEGAEANTTEKPKEANFTLVPKYLIITSTDFLGDWLEWTFYDINDTHWQAVFEIDEDLFNDIKEALPYDTSDHRWEDIRNIYFDGNTIVKTADSMKQFSVGIFPLTSPDTNIRFHDFEMYLGGNKTKDIERDYGLGGSFVIEFIDGFKLGKEMIFGFGSTVVTTTTDEGTTYNDYSWNNRVFWDPNNNRWHVVYIASDSDIHTASSPDGLTWTDGIDIDVNTYDNQDFSCVLDVDGASTYLHCVYSVSTRDYLNYERATLTGISPFITAGSEEEPFDASAMGQALGDDVGQPKITIDSNRCILIVFDFEDASEDTPDEHEVVLLKEDAGTTCGDGDYDNGDSEAGFPIYSVQSDVLGYNSPFEIGIESYGDLDAQIYWIDTDDSGLWDLETIHFDGDTDSVGTQVTLETDVENVHSYSAVIAGTHSHAFATDDGSTALDDYAIATKDGTSWSQNYTGMGVYQISAQAGGFTAVVNTNATGSDDIWVFGVDNNDDTDLLYLNSTDNGLTWSAETLWINGASVGETKFLSAYMNETCAIMVTWLSGSASPFSLNTSIIIAGDCSEAAPEGDTCTYGGSGLWQIDCTEYCEIDTDTDVGTNGIEFTGVGEIKLNANIEADWAFVEDGCDVFKMAGKQIYTEQ